MREYNEMVWTQEEKTVECLRLGKGRMKTKGVRLKGGDKTRHQRDPGCIARTQTLREEGKGGFLMVQTPDHRLFEKRQREKTEKR